jgi:hypothetical protein
VTSWEGGAEGLTDRQRAGIRRALARWREHRAWLTGGVRPDREPSGAEASGAPEPAGPLEPTGPEPDLPGSAPADEPAGAEEHDRAIGLDIEIVDVELLRPGRPGVLDVVAEMDGRLAHAVFGLRRPGDELHIVGAVDEPALGVVEDEEGLAVLVDAMHDADAARLLLESVAGAGRGHDGTPVTTGGPGGEVLSQHRLGRGSRRPAARRHPSAVVTLAHEDADVTTLSIDHTFTLSVFPWLHRGPHPGVTLLAGLDEAGFNHLPAPVALWRRAGRDLGIAQELLAGAAGGWALALTSLRDLLAAGVSPDSAGGDFAPEAMSLGTMTARMHLALDRAFGRRAGDVAAWAEAVEDDLSSAPFAAAAFDRTSLGTLDASMREILRSLRASELHPPVIRTHGDFHLGRTARTDHGWVLVDCRPGGTEPGSDLPAFRSPLADVADLLWSLHHVALVAAAEHGPVTAPSRASELAASWEARNRRAFVASYLATPGIGGLVPAGRDLVRRLLAVYEVVRAVRAPAAQRALG